MAHHPMNVTIAPNKEGVEKGPLIITTWGNVEEKKLGGFCDDNLDVLITARRRC